MEGTGPLLPLWTKEVPKARDNVLNLWEILASFQLGAEGRPPNGARAWLLGPYSADGKIASLSVRRRSIK